MFPDVTAEIFHVTPVVKLNDGPVKKRNFMVIDQNESHLPSALLFVLFFFFF